MHDGWQYHWLTASDVREILLENETMRRSVHASVIEDIENAPEAEFEVGAYDLETAIQETRMFYRELLSLLNSNAFFHKVNYKRMLLGGNNRES